MTIRQILVSTDVFAALWAKHQPGEDSENAILERLLGLPKGPSLPFSRQSGPIRITEGQDGGIYNQMFDVRFPQGFEIFRTYKGRDYSAVVQGGRWIMNGQSFPSLFALSMAIIDSRENPWMHWKYRDGKGRTNFISAMRNIPPELDETSPKPGEETARPRKKKPAGRKRTPRR